MLIKVLIRASSGLLEMLLMELVGCGKETSPESSFLSALPLEEFTVPGSQFLVSWLKPDSGSTSLSSSKISPGWFLILGADLPLPNPTDLLLQASS